MREHPRMKRIIILFFMLSTMFGCLPETQRTVVRPPQPRDHVSKPPLSLEGLEKRMIRIQKILERSDLHADDREAALELLSAYQAIGTLLKGGKGREDYPEIIRILFSNLGRLDDRHFSKIQEDDQGGARAIHLFSSKRKKIMDNYLYENYQGVIDECLELEASFGPESLTPEVGLVFSISLAKKGMVKEALNIGEKIIHQLEEKPDALYLRSRIIEWHIEMGDRERALEAYEKLMDTLDEKAALLKRAERAMGTKGEGEDIKPLSEMAGQQTGPMEQLLKKVDGLVERHEFKKAKILLIRERIGYKEGAETQTIDQALKSVDLAEERWTAKESANTVPENDGLKSARKLIEEEKYEEAILLLERIEKDPKSSSEKRGLKDLAIEKIINRERNRAAQLFLMARNTEDPEKKKALLDSSYQKLKELIEKYPSSHLISKLNSHLAKVKEELIKLEIN